MVKLAREIALPRRDFKEDDSKLPWIRVVRNISIGVEPKKLPPIEIEEMDAAMSSGVIWRGSI